MAAFTQILDITRQASINSVDGTAAQQRALRIEEFTGLVHATLERESIVADTIDFRSVTGTDSFTNNMVGASVVQKHTPGQALQGIKSDFAKRALVVDVLLACREAFPILDTVQNPYDAIAKVAVEQGKALARVQDQGALIQVAKTAQFTESTYSNSVAGKPSGHFGGNQLVLPSAADAKDPAKMYKAFGEILVKFQEKDVNTETENLMFIVTPATWFILAQSEYLINSNYISANGNSINGGSVLKEFGIPIRRSNNLPTTNITGHILNGPTNVGAYDGDFSKLVALVYSPKCLMAGQSIPMKSKIHWEDMYFADIVSTWTAYAMGPDIATYAGIITTA